MIRLDIKNCNMILTEEQQKNHHDHWEKVINMNTLQVKNHCLLIKQKL